jgi:hypothetical protein
LAENKIKGWIHERSKKTLEEREKKRNWKEKLLGKGKIFSPRVNYEIINRSGKGRKRRGGRADGLGLKRPRDDVTGRPLQIFCLKVVSYGYCDPNRTSYKTQVAFCKCNSTLR